MALPNARVMAGSEAPVIDVSALWSGTDIARRQLAYEIAEVCREIGFFYIVNHGVSASSTASMFDSARTFFELPLDEKMEIAMTLSRSYRGYLPLKMIGEGAGLKGNL